MSLPANKNIKIVSLGDMSGGLNVNDPAVSITENQLAACQNVILLKKGFKRWPGAENLTTKDDIADVFRGLFSHGVIAGTQYLYGVWGGKVYSVNKATGAIGSALYDLTGTGEASGGSHWGKFYMCNGTKCCKVEGGSAYQIGISAPTTGAAAAAAGGTLPDGVYKIFVGYARRISGVNVLYSQGYALSDITLGGGNNTVSITGFANSADAQVGNKVVWMTNAGGTTYYFFSETTNNTTTTITISDTSAQNNAVIYDTYAMTNALPGAFTYMYAFDNRLWGIIGNNLYYSQKATVSYDLEKFPTINKIEFPYQLTGIFSLGTNLYLNTADNGIMVLPNANVGARYEHTEQRESFSFMNTVADWNGGKIGLTKNKVGFFDGNSFQPFDYGYNIRPVLQKIWGSTTADFMPVGFTYRRDNRIEYAISFRDTDLGTANNNRTYVLNLSQTFFQDSANYKTPWEMVDRGFNYVAVDSANQAFYAQSYAGSSQIYKEYTIHSWNKGIYDKAGTFLTAATTMTASVTSKTIIENMFTKQIIGETGLLFNISKLATITVSILDDLAKNVSQATGISTYASTAWDAFNWDTANWASEGVQQYKLKEQAGTFGYAWNWSFMQNDDDINLLLTDVDVMVTKETGRGI
jgi:hypothetical protein